MQRSMIAGLLAGALALGGAGAASAAGFQLLEQNASGIGNAYAGSAAVAENASTIFFNPAGMTQLQAREASVGLAAVRPSYEFSNTGSISGVLSGDGGDAGGWGYLPNAYLSWALNKDVYVGLGLSAPFGLQTDYDDKWIGAAQAEHFDVMTIDVNPSVAWRVSDKLSLGAGASWQRLEVDYRRRVSIVTPATAGTTAKLDAASDAGGWNLGALWTVSATTRLGFSYRSKVDHELEGDLKIGGTLAGFGPALTTGHAKAKVELPDTAIFSVAQKLDNRWEMLGDVSWTGWSSIDKLNIARTVSPWHICRDRGDPSVSWVGQRRAGRRGGVAS